MLAEYDRTHRTQPPDAVDRHDHHDPHVTAVRRLAPVEAAYAPFPEVLDTRLCRALAARGITQP